MKRKLPLILLFFLFLGITLFSGTQLYLQWKEYRAGEQTYENLTSFVQIEPTQSHVQDETRPNGEAPENPDASEPTEAPVRTPPILVDFESLQAINPEVVAWIYVEGTSINYPVVQGPNNNYYLDKLFDGKYNSSGSIFMDYRNTSDLSDRNTIIYGHNMQNGTMFNHINNYKRQDYYDKHPVGLLITPEGTYTLEFVAGYVASVNSDAWRMDFLSDKDFSIWLADAMEQSTFTSTVKPEASDRVVTLSTCTYEFNQARYVLVAILRPYQ